MNEEHKEDETPFDKTIDVSIEKENIKEKMEDIDTRNSINYSFLNIQISLGILILLGLVFIMLISEVPIGQLTLSLAWLFLGLVFWRNTNKKWNPLNK